LRTRAIDCRRTCRGRGGRRRQRQPHLRQAAPLHLPRPRGPGRRLQLSGASARAPLELPVEAFQREPPNDMPAFSTTVVSDKEAADVWAFLRSLPGRKPVKDFALLKLISGAQLAAVGRVMRRVTLSS
jgi:hypothetical protein